MISGLKKIDRLLWEPLVWVIVDEKCRIYSSSKYSIDECWLQMNDFPDEPLWTLFFKGEKKDIEDTPLLWKINYNGSVNLDNNR